MLFNKKIILLDQKNGCKYRDTVPLRTVPPFVTAHTFRASRDIRVLYSFSYKVNNIFARFMTVKNADLSKVCQNPKRKLGVTTSLNLERNCHTFVVH